MAQRCSSVLRGLTRGFRLGPWNLDETRLNACFFSAGQMLGGGAKLGLCLVWPDLAIHEPGRLFVRLLAATLTKMRSLVGASLRLR